MTSTDSKRRSPLTPERLFATAVALADAHGIEAVTMRRLAEALDVEAMSLYYHVANKEAVLDGIVEVVMGELVSEVSSQEPARSDWKGALRHRILAARKVMLRHRWAPAVIETRTTISPASMAYFDGILGIFRAGGVSYDLAHHAMHALGSRALGFTQELFEPDEGDDPDIDMEAFAGQFPYLVEMMSEIVHEDDDATLGWCDDQFEFEFGLDIILDGIERRNQG